MHCQGYCTVTLPLKFRNSTRRVPASQQNHRKPNRCKDTRVWRTNSETARIARAGFPEHLLHQKTKHLLHTKTHRVLSNPEFSFQRELGGQQTTPRIVSHALLKGTSLPEGLGQASRQVSAPSPPFPGRDPRLCPLGGTAPGQHRRSPGSPRAGSRAQPRGAASPRAAEPRPCGSRPGGSPGRPRLCGDTAAPAPRAPRPRGGRGGASRRRRRRKGEGRGRSHYQSFVAVLAEGAAENSLDVAKVPVAEVRGADDNVVALHGAGAASSGRARRGWAGRAGAGAGGGRGCGPSGAARPREEDEEDEEDARRGGRGGAERAAAAAGRHSAIIASSLAGRLH